MPVRKSKKQKTAVEKLRALYESGELKEGDFKDIFSFLKHWEYFKETIVEEASYIGYILIQPENFEEREKIEEFLETLYPLQNQKGQYIL